MNVSLMTRSTDNHHQQKWGIRLERAPATPSSALRERNKPDRFRGFRVFVMSTFMMHAIVYAILMTMLMVINLLTWEGFLWVVFPVVSWGAFLAVHGGFAWMIASVGAPSRMVDRAQQPMNMPRIRKAPPVDDNTIELRGLMSEGLTKVDAMRAIGRTMRQGPARRDALTAVNAIEETLIALDENVDELPLAREFVGGLIDPAHRVFVEYSRLSTRDVQGAKALLQQVEQQDLPRITARAEEVHDRVHRGTMIDLEVAREMLSLSRREDEII